MRGRQKSHLGMRGIQPQGTLLRQSCGPEQGDWYHHIFHLLLSGRGTRPLQDWEWASEMSGSLSSSGTAKSKLASWPKPEIPRVSPLIVSIIPDRANRLCECVRTGGLQRTRRKHKGYRDWPPGLSITRISHTELWP